MTPTVAVVVALVAAAGTICAGLVCGGAIIWRLSAFKTSMEKDIVHLGAQLGAQIAELKGGTRDTEVDLDALCSDVTDLKTHLAEMRADVRHLDERLRGVRPT